MDFWVLLDLIGKQFPQYLPFLSEPGVFDIFKQALDPATADEWSPVRIQAAIANTPFFKNNTLAQRQWYFLDSTDPATAAQKKADATTSTSQIAEQLGLNLPAYDQAIIALNAAVNGWDATRIRMELVAKSSGSTALGPGGIGDTMNQYQALAAAQGVPINHTDLYWWAANTEGGNVTSAGFNDYLMQQAKNLYPALAPALDQGQTVSQFAQPYFAMATQELGIAPTQINLLNPKWTELFLGADKAGNQGVLSMNEALQKVRTDPSYGYDAGLPGRTQASQFATTLLQKFGAAA